MSKSAPRFPRAPGACNVDELGHRKRVRHARVQVAPTSTFLILFALYGWMYSVSTSRGPGSAVQDVGQAEVQRRLVQRERRGAGGRRAAEPPGTEWRSSCASGPSERMNWYRIPESDSTYIPATRQGRQPLPAERPVRKALSHPVPRRPPSPGRGRLAPRDPRIDRDLHEQFTICARDTPTFRAALRWARNCGWAVPIADSAERVTISAWRPAGPVVKGCPEGELDDVTVQVGGYPFQRLLEPRRVFLVEIPNCLKARRYRVSSMVLPPLPRSAIRGESVSLHPRPRSVRRRSEEAPSRAICRRSSLQNRVPSVGRKVRPSRVIAMTRISPGPAVPGRSFRRAAGDLRFHDVHLPLPREITVSRWE